jgi:hypothetical protein
MGCGLGGPRFELRQGQEIFFAPKHLDRLCGPRSLLLYWYLGSFLGNGSGREADYSPPPSAEVNDEWSYTSTPQRRLHSVDRQLNFFFLLESKEMRKTNFRDCWFWAVTLRISDRNIPMAFGGTYFRHLHDMSHETSLSLHINLRVTSEKTVVFKELFVMKRPTYKPPP